MFHITQPSDSMIGIWSIMVTFSGDVQYSQVMGHLTTPAPPKMSPYLQPATPDPVLAPPMRHKGVRFHPLQALLIVSWRQMNRFELRDLRYLRNRW